MERFDTHDGKHVVVRLDDGEPLLESLQALATAGDLAPAAIVCGVGALRRLHVHVPTVTTAPPQSRFLVVEEPLELCTVAGMITDRQTHVHVTASNGEQTWGGHLEPQTIVLYLAEIVLQRLDADLTHVTDERQLPVLSRREEDGGAG